MPLLLLLLQLHFLSLIYLSVSPSHFSPGHISRSPSLWRMLHVVLYRVCFADTMPFAKPSPLPSSAAALSYGGLTESRIQVKKEEEEHFMLPLSLPLSPSPLSLSSRLFFANVAAALCLSHQCLQGGMACCLPTTVRTRSVCKKGAQFCGSLKNDANFLFVCS